jgi:hypothetical protein
LHYSTNTHDSGDKNKENEGVGQMTSIGAYRVLVSKAERMNNLKNLGLKRG